MRGPIRLDPSTDSLGTVRAVARCHHAVVVAATVIVGNSKVLKTAIIPQRNVTRSPPPAHAVERGPDVIV